MRMAAAQPRNRTIDFRLRPAEALAEVDRSLAELEQLVRKAGRGRLRRAGASRRTRWACSSGKRRTRSPGRGPPRGGPPDARPARQGGGGPPHVPGPVQRRRRDRTVACTTPSFLLGRDGKEIGRYHKVNLPLAEQSRARGRRFPVFPTPDLGTVGMLICYDMVFPEAARCLALEGADVVFHPTLGGAAVGDDDISLAAFRTRAVDNFVYLVVAMRGQRQHDHLAAGQGPRHREGARRRWPSRTSTRPAVARAGTPSTPSATCAGRLFRERVPEAYGILTDPDPPVLAKVPSNVTRDEAIRIMATVLTTGEERFNEAEALARAGKTEEAIRLFERLCEECRTSWIDRAARERLKTLRPPGGVTSAESPLTGGGPGGDGSRKPSSLRSGPRCGPTGRLARARPVPRSFGVTRRDIGRRLPRKERNRCRVARLAGVFCRRSRQAPGFLRPGATLLHAPASFPRRSRPNIQIITSRRSRQRCRWRAVCRPTLDPTETRSLRARRPHP